MVKNFCAVLILFLTTLSAAGQEYHIYFSENSKVLVYGSTNVNRFTFQYTEILSIVKPVQVAKINGILRLSDCSIDLKVRAFDSGNGLMNKDFRTMMNEEENPFITVDLLSIKPVWNEDGSWRNGNVDLEVKINEIKKRYTVQCTVENPGSLFIHGQQKLLLGDFNLVPPTRMMGMVKVSEVVELNMALRFSTDR